MSQGPVPDRVTGMTLRTLLGYGWGWGVAVVVATLLSSCDDAVGIDPDAAQGIEGLVLLGPQCPVQRLEDPCPDVPYEADIEIRAPSGALVGRVRSGTDGRFRAGLAPGRYVLDPVSGDPFPVATEQVVDVEVGVYAEVVVPFDTGIR